MQINLHQTHHEIADFEAIYSYLTQSFSGENINGLHVFPELFLCGYPLQDLVYRKSFIEEYQRLLEDLSIWSEKQLKSKQDLLLLVGGLRYSFDAFGLPTHIENGIYAIRPGKKLEFIYTKRLLPNYDIFEEQKYFTPGHENKIIQFQGKNLALLVCEDMWFSHMYEVDPIEELASQELKIDYIINLSASPYHLGKKELRKNRAMEISQMLKAPFVFVNRVGAEDEILFDGASFIINSDETVVELKSFEAEKISVEVPLYKNAVKLVKSYTAMNNSWQSIFTTRLSSDTRSLLKLSDEDCQEILSALIFGIKDYSKKNGLNKFTIALSGGIDSSLVLTILKIMQKDFPVEIEAVFLPGLFSSSLSFDLSYDLCQNLGIKLTTMPIKFIHSTIKNAYKDAFHQELAGLADENIQSRLRGALIYLRSNAQNSVVLNTSNKSELSVGYSTIYGDSVGALSVLGDLYKTEVFELAHFVNRKYNKIIPEEIITRPPSAELRENQVDAESLPPYDRLDSLLESLLSGRYSSEDLIAKGHEASEVTNVNKLLKIAEYKRRQFCPIIKVKAKSFGFGHRMPISKKLL